jgi:hypothetical protein
MVLELRNIIYGYYEANGRENVIKWDDPFYAFLAEIGEVFTTDYRWFSIAPKGQTERARNEPVRGPQALLQVCKQLRNEYRPIYIENLSGYINWTDLPKYLSTFFHEAELVNCPKDVYVYLHSVRDDNTALGADYVDIYPLLKMRSTRPDFSIIFDDESVASDHFSLYHPNRSILSLRPKRRVAQCCYELTDLFRDGLDNKWTGDMAGKNFRQVRVYRWEPNSKKKDFMAVYALDVDAPTSESEFKPVLKGKSPKHKTGYYYVPAKKN